MPDARQGDIHWYDFGPVIGAELSGRRPALVISNDDFNRAFGVAIAIPMSRTMPAEERRTQHIYISASNSWASAWQMKSIDQGRLGDRIGRALTDEMDDVLGSLLLRLNRRHDPGWIQTMVGLLPIGAGSVWDLTLTGPDQDECPVSVLIIDYNAGNGMAITVEVVPGEPRPGSPCCARRRTESLADHHYGHRCGSLRTRQYRARYRRQRTRPSASQRSAARGRG